MNEPHNKLLRTQEKLQHNNLSISRYSKLTPPLLLALGLLMGWSRLTPP